MEQYCELSSHCHDSSLLDIFSSSLRKPSDIDEEAFKTLLRQAAR
jgi:hypothetical protein